MDNTKLVSKGLAGILVEKTELSCVDGINGILTYCGYNINSLTECKYEEICFLFLYGYLPKEKELNRFEEELIKERDIPEYIIDFIYSHAKKDNPMAMLRTAVSMLSISIKGLEDKEKNEEKLRSIAISLISKISTISAAICRGRDGLKAILPNKELGHSANFLYMLRNKIPNKIIEKALDLSLILHADHSFNASTFTTRVIGSSLSDMVSAVSGAIGSLKGPLHGGANTEVMKTLLEIGEEDNVELWLNNALKNKEKVMGFGHRVYKVLDPRAIHLKNISKEWGKQVGEVKWFNMSEKLEKLIDSKKGLKANVDFYSASSYYAMGINPETYTIIFALSRIVGWCAHYIEQLKDNRIMRPSALYIGEKNKGFIKISERV